MKMSNMDVYQGGDYCDVIDINFYDLVHTRSV